MVICSINKRPAEPGESLAVSVGGEAIVSTGRGIPDPLVRDDSDAALVARARTGDVGAFGELVNRYSRTVYAAVSRMIDDRDDIDDIAQEVFVLAYRSIASFRGDSEFSTWIYRIAINTTIKQMKKMKVRKAASIDDPATGLADALVSSDGERPERIAEKKARDEALKRAIEKLPEKHRVVVIMHYFQNCDCQQIAKILDCSVGTVWSRLHYACRKLQQQMEIS